MKAQSSEKAGVASVLLTLRELADYLRVHPTVYRLLRAKQLPESGADEPINIEHSANGQLLRFPCSFLRSQIADQTLDARANWGSLNGD
jgi:hypothetical protein